MLSKHTEEEEVDTKNKQGDRIRKQGHQERKLQITLDPGHTFCILFFWGGGWGVKTKISHKVLNSGETRSDVSFKRFAVTAVLRINNRMTECKDHIHMSS